MPALRIQIEDGTIKRHELTRGDVTVGRHPDCDFVLADSTVSRRHTRVFLRAKDYYVEDLGSRNGTYVNDQRILGPTVLHNGDEIRVHDLLMKFEDADRLAFSLEPPPTDEINLDGDEDEDQFSLLEQRHLLRETIADLRQVWEDDEFSLRPDPQVKLQVILDITRDLGSSLEVELVLPRVLNSVFRAFPQATRGYILECDTDGSELILAAEQSRIDNGPKTKKLSSLTKSISRKVLADGVAVLSSDADPVTSVSGSAILDLAQKSLLCAPVIGPSRQRLGIIYVETDDTHAPFTSDDLDLLSCIAVLAGQAVEHAQLSALRYRAVVDTAVDGIITINEEGLIESVNPATEKLFGFTQSELVQHDVNLLMSPAQQSDEETASRPLNELLQSATTHEVIGRRKDNSEFPLYLSVGRFQLNGRKHFTGIVHDISKRKQQELELKTLNDTLERRVEERTRYVKLLQDVAVIANEAGTISESLFAVMECICQRLEWRAGHAWTPIAESPDVLGDSGIWYGQDPAEIAELQSASVELSFGLGDGVVGGVLQSGKPAWLVEPDQDPRFNGQGLYRQLSIESAFAFPVLVGSEVCAVIEFFLPHGHKPNADLHEVMAHAGTQLGRVVERCRLQKEMVDAVWKQQQTFGQELHDSLGQELTGIRMLSECLHSKLLAQGRDEAQAVGELSELLHGTQQRVRQLSKGLYPVEVFEAGLMAALAELADGVCRQSEIDCRFVCEEAVEIAGNDMATHLFRIAQEATNNAAKHSQARQIEISLSTAGQALVLKVCDDGIGLQTGQPQRGGGMGLRIMHYRAGAIGGRLAIESMPGKGTEVVCRVEQTATSGARP